MIFQIYGDTSLTQILGWCMVFVGLILLNELGRRTKWGGILLFEQFTLFLSMLVYLVEQKTKRLCIWMVGSITSSYMLQTSDA